MYALLMQFLWVQVQVLFQVFLELGGRFGVGAGTISKFMVYFSCNLQLFLLCQTEFVKSNTVVRILLRHGKPCVAVCCVALT